MKLTHTRNPKSIVSRVLLSAGVLLALVLTTSAVAAADSGTIDDGYALAGDKHRRHYDRHRHDDRYDRHRYEDRYDRHRYDDRYDRRDYRYDNHDHYDHRYDSRSYRSHRRHFQIPRSIVRGHSHNYRSYYYGRVYHSSHRHYHEVYRFPVYGEYGVSYSPYAYCQGEFFARGAFGRNGPVFDLRISF